MARYASLTQGPVDRQGLHADRAAQAFTVQGVLAGKVCNVDLSVPVLPMTYMCAGRSGRLIPKRRCWLQKLVSARMVIRLSRCCASIDRNYRSGTSTEGELTCPLGLRPRGH